MISKVSVFKMKRLISLKMTKLGLDCLIPVGTPFVKTLQKRTGIKSLWMLTNSF